MKKLLNAGLAAALVLLFSATTLTAQTGANMCKGCKQTVPTEVLTSSKNTVTFSGPPDGKGKPVEFLVFTQSKTGGAWVLANTGVMEKPGSKETFKYYKPGQLLVLIYCETPFGNMAEFSNSRVAPPPPPSSN